MTNQEISKDTMHKWHPCGTICSGKNSGLFWGVLFIVVGLYWLGKAAGWIPAEIKMFWPIVFIGAGLWFVISSLVHKKTYHSNE